VYFLHPPCWTGLLPFLSVWTSSITPLWTGLRPPPPPFRPLLRSPAQAGLHSRLLDGNSFYSPSMRPPSAPAHVSSAVGIPCFTRRRSPALQRRGYLIPDNFFLSQNIEAGRCKAGAIRRRRAGTDVTVWSKGVVLTTNFSFLTL
jgi:hypothetical protein